MQEKGRQDPRKADAPSNKGKQEGVQWETRPSKRRTHHPQRDTIRGTIGDTLGKADTLSNKGNGYNGRQGETTPPARRTHLPTRGDKKGYNRRQRETRPSARQQEGVQGAMGDKEQWETKGNKKEGAQWETSGDKVPGRRPHQPTKGNNKACNGRQKETRPWGRRAHHPTPRRPPY